MDTSNQVQWIEELREQYAKISGDSSVSPTRVAMAAARRRRRNRIALAGAFTVATAAIAAPIALSAASGVRHDTSPGDGVAATSSDSPTPEPNGVSPASAGEFGAAVDRVYAVIDSNPNIGYYMLTADPNTQAITLWGSIGPTDLTAARAAAADLASVQVQKLPADLDPYHVQGAVDAASELIRNLVGDPGYGFCYLKVQLPQRSIVVWRVHPDEAIDRRLRGIATDAGLTLELRNATTSQEDATRLADELVAANSTWNGLGFRVLGAYARPAGAVVSVTGDLAAAQRAIGDRPGVLAVMDGTTITAETQVTIH